MFIPSRRCAETMFQPGRISYLLRNFQTAGDIFVNLQLSIYNLSNIPACGGMFSLCSNTK
jgi:hypothetical protein